MCIASKNRASPELPFPCLSHFHVKNYKNSTMNSPRPPRGCYFAICIVHQYNEHCLSFHLHVRAIYIYQHFNYESTAIPRPFQDFNTCSTSTKVLMTVLPLPCACRQHAAHFNISVLYLPQDSAIARLILLYLTCFWVI